MGKRIVFCLLVLIMTFSNFGVSKVEASARTMDWSVVIYYQNVGENATPVTVKIFPENEEASIDYDPGYVLEPGGSGSFFAGNIGEISKGFRGNAVLLASEPITATMMFLQSDPPKKLRMFSNGFSSSDGSNQFLIATTLANRWDRTTIISIQNLESESITVNLKFFDADIGVFASEIEHIIPANSSKYIEMDSQTDTGITSPIFNGSLIIDASKTEGGGSANVVASANELYTDRDVGASFGGLPLSRASNKIYLSTALCKAYGLDTYYAVQNTSYTESATFIVEYFGTNGFKRTVDGPYTIGPGQKKSIETCSPSSGAYMGGFTGSAIIQTTDPSSRLVALGKAQTQRSNPSYTYHLFTIFNGESQGYSKIGFPYVRWANTTRFEASSNMGTYQRTYFAIQNLESTTSKVNLFYYDKDGGLVSTHELTISANSKANSDAKVAGALGKNGMNNGEFGYYSDGSSGGSVILQAHPDNPTAQFTAILRVQHPGWGEDYNGIGIN